MDEEQALDCRRQIAGKGCLRSRRFLVAVMIVAALIYWDCSSGLTPQKIERMIQAEVPLRSSRAEVEAWFDKHGIRHEYTEDRVLIESAAENAGQASQIASMVTACILSPEGNPGCGHFMRGRVMIWFLFDQDGRLVFHRVEGQTPML